jgi:hypothetical protein
LITTGIFPYFLRPGFNALPAAARGNHPGSGHISACPESPVAQVNPNAECLIIVDFYSFLFYFSRFAQQVELIAVNSALHPQRE